MLVVSPLQRLLTMIAESGVLVVVKIGQDTQ